MQLPQCVPFTFEAPSQYRRELPWNHNIRANSLTCSLQDPSSLLLYHDADVPYPPSLRKPYFGHSAVLRVRVS